jgi:hypothetical protein
VTLGDLDLYQSVIDAVLVKNPGDPVQLMRQEIINIARGLLSK